MAIHKTKKAKSPTGRPSKVKPAVKDFMQGKRTGGKRPAAAPAKKKVVRGNVADAIRDRNRRIKEATNKR